VGAGCCLAVAVRRTVWAEDEATRASTTNARADIVGFSVVKGGSFNEAAES
jgi:hypothetical protein